ncbi:hypothetical protein HH212_14160 [Massilia forsythiae]|uniref:Uncharacterized protein n=1 Tax=Massilia forsythiae TaxID=2728020 RepID=A0A7Z2ZSZ2_9BURK|nr:hypothetical protein [Massilia forsythiae]QJE01033.1 hypothetical protein HH212_14160 [Massilia forsythiae]
MLDIICSLSMAVEEMDDAGKFTFLLDAGAHVGRFEMTAIDDGVWNRRTEKAGNLHPIVRSSNQPKIVILSKNLRKGILYNPGRIR